MTAVRTVLALAAVVLAANGCSCRPRLTLSLEAQCEAQLNELYSSLHRAHFENEDLAEAIDEHLAEETSLPVCTIDDWLSESREGSDSIVRFPHCVDPWGNEILIERVRGEGERNHLSLLLVSSGPDGRREAIGGDDIQQRIILESPEVPLY